MLTRLRVVTIRLSRHEEGATAVEYGLIISLVAFVIAAVVRILGGEVQVFFQSVTNGFHP